MLEIIQLAWRDQPVTKLTIAMLYCLPPLHISIRPSGKRQPQQVGSEHSAIHKHGKPVVKKMNKIWRSRFKFAGSCTRVLQMN